MSAGTDVHGPAALVLHRVRVPLRRAHRAAHGAEAVREVVLVEWRTHGGPSGWGECPTLASDRYVTETTDEAWAALTGRLGPAALRGVAVEPDGAPAAAAALADARLDAELRATGVGLARHLGATRSSVERCTVLAAVGEPVDSVVARAVAAERAGASMVKLKVTPEVGGEQLRAVLDAVRCPVAADANGSFEEPGGLRPIDGLGLAYLEQPFPPTLGPEGIARARAGLDTPVALDESITDTAALDAAIDAGALDVVSVKPARMGGVLAAARAVELAREHGLGAFVGGMLELGIGRAAAVVVAALEGCTLPTDLGPSEQYVEADVCEPVVLDGEGRLEVPTGPGCGREPGPELARRTVDRVVLTP